MRHIVALSTFLLVGASPALATPFTVTTGTDTTGKTITGTEAGSIASGAALSTSGVAITWSGPSATPGATIDNSGTINSTGGRGIDTSGSNTVRNLTFNNNVGSTLSAANDAFRINSDVVNSTVTVNNAGMINSATGQALDFDAVSSPTANIRINNLATGVIQAGQADAVRPGQAATVTNAGMICAGTVSGGGCSGGIVGESNDGVDWQGHNGTLINEAGGVISGQRHGTTSDVDVNVTNEAGGLILGRNGSGVGSDGTGTVVNRGTIRGAYDGLAANGDGDGVDIDQIAHVTNFGVIEGTGAAGVGSDGLANTSEGLAIGGGTVDNKAGARITGAATGMLVDNSSQGGSFAPTNVTNAGTIEGKNGQGIKLLGTQADTIRNSGKISGTTGAIDMGAGNDLLQLETGSIIQGKADGGDGIDKIQILTSVTVGDVENFEVFDLAVGAIATLATDLNVDELLGALIDGDKISNIIGNGNDFFYDAADAANAYLKGLSYQLAGGGMVMAAAVPEPMTLALFLPALIAIGAAGRRKNAAAVGAVPAAA